MKSMCQAAWLLTVAFGNIVVVIIAESSAFDNQVRTIHLEHSIMCVLCRHMSLSSLLVQYSLSQQCLP